MNTAEPSLPGCFIFPISHCKGKPTDGTCSITAMSSGSFEGFELLEGLPFLFSNVEQYTTLVGGGRPSGSFAPLPMSLP